MKHCLFLHVEEMLTEVSLSAQEVSKRENSISLTSGEKKKK